MSLNGSTSFITDDIDNTVDLEFKVIPVLDELNEKLKALKLTQPTPPTYPTAPLAKATTQPMPPVAPIAPEKPVEDPQTWMGMSYIAEAWTGKESEHRQTVKAKNAEYEAQLKIYNTALEKHKLEQENYENQLSTYQVNLVDDQKAQDQHKNELLEHEGAKEEYQKALANFTQLKSELKSQIHAQRTAEANVGNRPSEDDILAAVKGNNLEKIISSENKNRRFGMTAFDRMAEAKKLQYNINTLDEILNVQGKKPSFEEEMKLEAESQNRQKARVKA
ncbi:MAG: hypothetical protein JSS07_03590 [Proteobacteria bacterium]|nr:hypothetical protein [Pseudomonadota bacterium]